MRLMLVYTAAYFGQLKVFQDEIASNASRMFLIF